VVDTTSQVEVPYNSHRHPWAMGAAHPSDLDDRSILGRSLDEAYIEKARGRGDVQPEPDLRREETTERWPWGKEGQGVVARMVPCARAGESIEMPSRARPVYRIRRYTSLSSARQLLLRLRS
jgi:hypothetical protein